ncbi:MAG: SRPBCC family protein [Saprospiraceae bacterium]|nr:SRPBCC family protein [Saprospiraceae bacterium]
MKYLKYLLYLILTLVVCLLLIGTFIKKVEYSSHVSINKPLKEVWAVYQDEGKMRDWLEGFESIELVKGNRNDIGSEYIVKMNQEGQTFEIKETLKSYKEFENINFDFDNEMMLMNYNTEFTENEIGTTIHSRSIVRGHGILMRAMMPFIKGSMIAQEEKNLRGLKEVIEANQKDYYPMKMMSLDSTIIESEKS